MSFEKVLVKQIKDLYSAENQILKALPKMEKAASDKTLKKAFHEHLKETKEHVSRLEQAAEILDCSVKGEKCHGMEGLIKEGEGTIKESDLEPEVRDALLIADAQRVEHYEIAGYGTVCSLAVRLGEDEIATLLQKTLDEEKEVDQKLTQICEQIHPALV